jgi:peptidoglycan/xylan/chitin deacetylase (PgdA/CDA1 family)
MVGTRARGVAALGVACALLATSLSPLLIATPPRGAFARAGDAPAPSPELVTAVVHVLPTATPGFAAAPASTPVVGLPEPTSEPADPPTRSSCEPAPSGLAPAPLVSHGSRRSKVVALTFDDGYGPTTTLKILQILRRSRVNATFFVTGRAVELFPGVWREVAAAGYPIADHTYDHKELAGMCFERQTLQLTRQADAVRAALGRDPVALMRPPYGARDANTQLAASAAGDEAVVLWDVDTRDWSGIAAWRIARNALAGGNGSIVLLHTLYANTASALPRIIAGYRARGFRFVTVGELLGVPGPVPFG